MFFSAEGRSMPFISNCIKENWFTSTVLSEIILCLYIFIVLVIRQNCTKFTNLVCALLLSFDGIPVAVLQNYKVWNYLTSRLHLSPLVTHINYRGLF